MRQPTRRGFLKGCSTAIAALAGARFTGFAFGAPHTPPDHDVLVLIFLRGGIDGLNLVLPVEGPDRPLYEAARPALRVPVTGPDRALSLASWAGNAWGLHPGGAPLHELWQEGKVAFVHCCGMDTPNRSHFDTQAQIELGTPGIATSSTGWLARHLLTAPGPTVPAILPAVAISSTVQTSWLGDPGVVAMASRDDFLLNTGPSAWRDAQRTALRAILETGSGYLELTGLAALDASLTVEEQVGPSSSYVPANGAVYPGGSFGSAMKLVAQIVKEGLGLRAVTLDLGGWDTHNGQGAAGAGTYFRTLLGQLSQGIHALYTDLDGAGGGNHASRLAVVVQSEFGRRVRENADAGTDHGHGNVMTVVGGGIRGGLYGAWNGLHHGALYDGADLPVTTDFRAVLSELLIERLGNPNVAAVFPGYTHTVGPGLAPMFHDGFESGDTGRWETPSR
jgi:uncharacterized protein (DUF1501 family)